MKRTTSIYVGFCCVITGIASLQIVTTSVSYFGRGETLRLDPLVWVACAAVMFVVNNILLRRSTLLPVLVGVNAVLFGLSLFALIQTAPALKGFFSHATVVVWTIITTVIAHRYSVRTQTLNSQIIVFDVYLILMGWQLFVLEAGLPGDDMPFLLVVLFLNIISNLALRSHEQSVGRALQASPVTGVFFSTGLFAAVFLIVFGIVRLFSSGTRTATVFIIKALRDGLLFVLAQLDRFFTWLFSLFSYREIEIDLEMKDEAPPGMEAVTEQFQVSPEILYIVVAVIALLAIAGLIYIVYRFRRTRLHEKSAAPSAARGVIRHGKGGSRLKNRLKALFDAITFSIKSLIYINTPPGTLIRLERWGKRRGGARRPGQSMRGYLLSLSSELAPVADDLDSIYYGMGLGRLSKADCRRMRRNFFRTRTRRGFRKHNGTQKSNSRP